MPAMASTCVATIRSARLALRRLVDGVPSQAPSDPSRGAPVGPIERWLPRLILIAAVLSFAAHVYWAAAIQIDDTYITLSFSKNLALGHGPVYSGGHLRVEGYSNFLWMLIVALPLAFTRGAYPIECARAATVPFTILLGWAVYRLVERVSGSRFAAASSVLLLSFQTAMATSFASGLETVPFVAVTVAALSIWIRSWDWPADWDGEPQTPSSLSRLTFARLTPWAALAVALMRIDGFIGLGFIATAELVRLLLARRFHAVSFARRWAPSIVTYGAYFAWRWAYYGLPLPTTYYAKALIPQMAPHQGWQYVTFELAMTGAWLGFVAAGWLILRRRWAAIPLVVFAAGHLAYVVRVGGDWMPFARFLLPALTLLYVLLMWGLADGVRAAGRRLSATGCGRRQFKVAVSIVLGPLFAILAARADQRFLNTPAERHRLAQLDNVVRIVHTLLRSAPLMSHVVPPGRRLVTDFGGVMAYFTDASIIEMWGLANRAIATRGTPEGVQPIYGKTCPACYAELDAEFFHAEYPLIFPHRRFRSAADVLASVWQADTIGRYVDLARGFAVGRLVKDDQPDQGLYFLEKRGPDFVSTRRRPAPGLVIEYPFEPR